MKKRLIDANALINDFKLHETAALIAGIISSARAWGKAKWLALDTPTIDAVEVVRCKDCVHRRSKLYCPMCDILADMSEDEGFCHCGEKKVEV